MPHPHTLVQDSRSTAPTDVNANANPHANTNAVLRLSDAGVCFGGKPVVQALVDVSLEIGAGERVALVGANGCGKSTLLRLLHGLLPLTTGKRWQAPNLRQAMVFQRPHMLRTSVLTHVALALWLAGMRWRSAKQQALVVLRELGLEHLAMRLAHTLSSGQQQRVAVARAYAIAHAQAATMLLLDEPTANLDPHAKREFEHLVQHIAEQEAAMTLVFASHNLGQVKRLASRVLYLEAGRVLVDLPVHDFFTGDLLRLQHPSAHAFVKGDLV